MERSRGKDKSNLVWKKKKEMKGKKMGNNEGISAEVNAVTGSAIGQEHCGGAAGRLGQVAGGAIWAVHGGWAPALFGCDAQLRFLSPYPLGLI